MVCCFKCPKLKYIFERRKQPPKDIVIVISKDYCAFGFYKDLHVDGTSCMSWSPNLGYFYFTKNILLYDNFFFRLIKFRGIFWKIGMLHEMLTTCLKIRGFTCLRQRRCSLLIDVMAATCWQRESRLHRDHDPPGILATMSEIYFCIYLLISENACFSIKVLVIFLDLPSSFRWK